MSIVEILLYGLLFIAVALAIAIPTLRWYKYNMSMSFKKSFAKYFMIATIIGAVVLVVYSFF